MGIYIHIHKHMHIYIVCVQYVLQSMGLQRVRYDCVTAQQQQIRKHTYFYYSATKKEENLLSVTIGMNTEDVMLREVSQRQIPYNPTCIWNLKTNKQTHRNRE